MTRIYGLYHEYTSDSGIAEEKAIGIYSSPERAQQAIERVKDKPGFRDHPDGFRIDELELDRDGWEEGFVRGNPNDPYSEEYEYDEKGFLVKRQPCE
jgi:hypothetical protein